MHYSFIYFSGVIEFPVDEGCWQGNWINYNVTLPFLAKVGYIVIHFIILIHTYD